jgi:flagellar basal-body rod protein FlgG
MLNGLYSAAAGMYAQQDRLDMLANDIANMDTTGYKQSQIGFEDLLYNSQQGVRVGSGAAIVDAGDDFGQGVLQQSSSPLSLAISGPGFFQVRQPDGRVALTRDGSFQLDAGGRLVTANGDRLAPPITLPRGTDPSQVSIAQDGTVSVGATRVGRIRIVGVAATAGLVALGQNLYQTSAASGPARAIAGSSVQQGYLEGSNVNLATALTSTMDAQRSYQLDSQAIQIEDQMMQVANSIRQ